MAFASKPGYEPEPVLVLFGCRPFVPYHGFAPDAAGNEPPFHAPPPTSAHPWTVGDQSWPRERCPTCGGRERRGVHCAWCALPARTRRQVARIVDAREAYAQAVWRLQRKVDERIQRTPILTEADRREFWEIVGPNGERIGEAWLRAIGQLPYWDDDPADHDDDYATIEAHDEATGL